MSKQVNWLHWHAVRTPVSSNGEVLLWGHAGYHNSVKCQVSMSMESVSGKACSGLGLISVNFVVWVMSVGYEFSRIVLRDSG